VPGKAHERMYEDILTDVQGSEEKLARMFVPGTTGLKTPLTFGDVTFMSEELYSGRSILSGILTKLVLIR
jgi:hypothetical protein